MLVFLNWISSALAGEPGEIYVISEPPGLEVWLDGHATGKIAPVMLYDLPPGAHQVEVRDRCRRGTAKVHLEDEHIERVEIEAKVGNGVVVWHLSPQDATARVDGEVVALNDRWTGDCGTHVIEVVKEGYHPQQREVELRGFETVEIEIALERVQYGALTIDVLPRSAELFVDGESVGTGPRTVERIPVGDKTLSATAAGYHAVSIPITIAPNDITVTSVVLSEHSTPAIAWDEPTPRRVPRWVAPVVLGTLAVGGGAWATAEWAQTSSAYREYRTTGRDYSDTVVPHRTRAYLATGLTVAFGVSAAMVAYQGEF